MGDDKEEIAEILDNDLSSLSEFSDNFYNLLTIFMEWKIFKENTFYCF